jgi:Flp pilus assembly protein TadG
MPAPRLNFRKRRGNVLVLSVVMMIVLVAFVAFAVDVGYLCAMRNELQRSADAAAMAAAWELVDENGPAGQPSAVAMSASAEAMAAQYAALNPVGAEEPGLASDDVSVGYMPDPSDPNSPMLPASGGTMPNAVQVRVQRTAGQNGRIPLFFARVLGYEAAASQAQATAALLYNIGGFQVPADGSNLGILPFALDVDTWNDLVDNGIGNDDYAFNPSSSAVAIGADAIKEINLYPQGTGSPGNRGTVDIGGSNNSTSDICRQIRDGISPQDMQDLYSENRTLELDEHGELVLNGDTGISAGVQDDLASIIGQPKIIPLFSVVNGPGNNAEYTIIGFVGVRVMYVKLTGSMSSKKVILQPANIVTRGGVAPSSGAQTSKFIYSPVWLVR